jgi:hypothetical protein
MLCFEMKIIAKEIIFTVMESLQPS